MKQFTKKERAKIYLEAAQLIDSDAAYFGCHALARSCGQHIDCYNIKIVFPEYALFKRKGAIACWFIERTRRANLNLRTLALLFAHHMALNP